MHRRTFLFFSLSTVLPFAVAQPAVVPLLVSEHLDATGKSAGVSTLTKKILAYLSKKSGVQFDLRPYPWRRALMLAEDGEAAIWGLSRNEEREKIFVFSHPIYATNVWMVVQKDRSWQIDSIQDLAGKRVSIFQGASLNSTFQKAREDGLFKVEEDPNNLQIRFSKLLAGRCDVMLVNNRKPDLAEVTAYFKQSGFDPTRLHIIDHPLIVDPIHIGVLKSKLAGFPMDALNNAIDLGRKNGEFDRM